MSAVIDLDPNILKALGYFRSNSIDSTEKLKAMLNDATKSLKGGTELRGISLGEKSIRSSSKVAKLSGNISDLKKRESPLLSKRTYDKVQESDEFSLDPAKKTYLGSSILSSSLKDSCSTIINAQNNGAFNKSSPVRSVSPDDFAREMAGLACAMCKKMTVGSGNRLVECQECHSLYHQDCHQPAVTDKDMNDPRRIWYCAKCKQNMRLDGNNLPSPLPLATATPVDFPQEKTVKTKTKASVTPFKRSELKPSLSSSNNNSGVTPMSGWAALSGKPALGGPQPPEGEKLSDTKQEFSARRSSIQKEKGKMPKNHSKPAPAMHGSDAWAEALGAKSYPSEKSKAANKSASSNNAKHLSLSTKPWLSTPGSNVSNKQKSSNSTNSATSHKPALFPKSSAGSSSSLKSISTHDSASKQIQLIKKKAAAKQQKRARI